MHYNFYKFFFHHNRYVAVVTQTDNPKSATAYWSILLYQFYPFLIIIHYKNGLSFFSHFSSY